MVKLIKYLCSRLATISKWLLFKFPFLVSSFTVGFISIYQYISIYIGHNIYLHVHVAVHRIIYVCDHAGLQKSTMSVHKIKIAMFFSTLCGHNSHFRYGNKMKFIPQVQKLMENLAKLTE